tara:strand:+ start:1201 stop:2073 length:873 start_codon:yes stop_codon:yes gene_type:complete
MGLVYSRIKFLLDAKNAGVKFDNTVMVGRQKISLSKKESKKLTSTYKLSNNIDDSILKERFYADILMEDYFGVKQLRFIDYSNYEGADIVTDLNYPIEKKFYNKFDTLIDGGSIEHIYNFPTAIENYMKMIKLGGSIFIFTNANNHCGHGFYQFSPEIFFSTFNESNGFKTMRVVFMEHPFPGAELSQRQTCYSIKNPMEIGRRSLVVNKSPLGIMVHATKIKECNIFEKFPIQSDYIHINKVKEKSINNKYYNMILKIVPKTILNNLLGIRQLKKFSLKADKEFFERLN